MAKMWAGRTDGQTDRLADDFNSSIGFDCRMYRQDITGSMAHAAMLGATGILPKADADTLIDGRSRRRQAAIRSRMRGHPHVRRAGSD